MEPRAYTVTGWPRVNAALPGDTAEQQGPQTALADRQTEAPAHRSLADKAASTGVGALEVGISLEGTQGGWAGCPWDTATSQMSLRTQHTNARGGQAVGDGVPSIRDPQCLRAQHS